MSFLTTSMELRLHTPIPHPAHPQLKHQVGALDAHLQFKVEVLKYQAFASRQCRKQLFRHGRQIRLQRTNRRQCFCARVGGDVGAAGD